MGNILKQCGAFFLHRGESSRDVVYRSVLNTYLKHLVTCESSPLQFFIEGTRSRSNKSISPKYGKLYYIYYSYESLLHFLTYMKIYFQYLCNNK